ncbi:transposase [Corallococcus sp. bb12-1]|uniref:transposase n=1 Tax=Corallococcus sp. bb12-1 TaxID=2996784 RepID=UPI0022709805|nr:transposase [Corallococcus sp. bb12-1]MCY1043198.1 transposase [Corallococcus sp. bb12-1]
MCLPVSANRRGWEKGQRTSEPFPEALRAFAVRYAEHVQETGGTVVEVAQRLGVSGPTLYEWRKGKPAGRARPRFAEKSAALVPVRVREHPAVAGVMGLQPVVLVSTGGWRVEGLSVEAAAQLLGRLEC